MKEFLLDLKDRGLPVALICNRYHYRGNIVSVGDDHVVLHPASLVEVSGISRNAKPQTEDQCSEPILISFRMVELIHRPTWVDAPIVVKR